MFFNKSMLLIDSRTTWAVESLEAFSFLPVNHRKVIFLSGNVASQSNLVFLKGELYPLYNIDIFLYIF